MHRLVIGAALAVYASCALPSGAGADSAPAISLVSTNEDHVTGIHFPEFAGATRDGSRSYFRTYHSVPGTGDLGGEDVYERRSGGSLRLITLPGSGPAVESHCAPSQPTSTFYFESRENVAALGDTDGARDIFGRRSDHSLFLASPEAGGEDADLAYCTADDRYLRFATKRQIPGTGDQNDRLDFFERGPGGSVRLLSSGGPSQHVPDLIPLVRMPEGPFYFSTQEAIQGTGDSDSGRDIYERTRAGALRLISTSGTDDEARFLGSTSDGMRAFFSTIEPVPGTGDVDSKPSVYERTADGAVRLVAPDIPCCISLWPGAGLRIFFTSEEPVPGTGDVNDEFDVYESLANGEIKLITTGSGDDGAALGGASVDDRRVFFSTEASLDLEDDDAATDIYAREKEGALTLISTGGADKPAHLARVSADGASVFFTTTEAISPWDSNFADDIYERREGGAVRLVTSGAGNSFVFFLATSSDGARAYFETIEKIPGTGDADDQNDIFVSGPWSAEPGASKPPPGTRPPLARGPAAGNSLPLTDFTSPRLVARLVMRRGRRYLRIRVSEPSTVAIGVFRARRRPGPGGRRYTKLATRRRQVQSAALVALPRAPTRRPGRYRVKLRARDAVGNAGRLVRVTFRVSASSAANPR